MAYELPLLQVLSTIHPVFHVFMICYYILDEFHVFVESRLSYMLNCLWLGIHSLFWLGMLDGCILELSLFLCFIGDINR